MATRKDLSMTYALPDEFSVFGFHRDLLAWYDSQKRDLPWRVDRDPYRVWVSEIMLQQTRVETVKPYYERFMARFPTVEALAEAPEEEVLKAWEGLGYYSRARNLLAAAREVKERYGGRIPDTREEISRLRGVGPYTAGAILSIAYDRPEPAVDGNVMRVFSRLLLLEDDIAKPRTRAKIEHLVRQAIPGERAGDFNQALMELGALVCLPRNPQCLTCPVFDYCLARQAGVQEQLPVKGKAKAPRSVDLLVAVVEKDGQLLINRRPERGLLAGLWEFPAAEDDPQREDEELLAQFLAARYGVQVRVERHLTDASHTFSHLHWNLRVYLCRWMEGEALPPSARFVPRFRLASYAFPKVYNRIIAALPDSPGSEWSDKNEGGQVSEG